MVVQTLVEKNVAGLGQGEQPVFNRLLGCAGQTASPDKGTPAGQMSGVCRPRGRGKTSVLREFKMISPSRQSLPIPPLERMCATMWDRLFQLLWAAGIGTSRSRSRRSQRAGNASTILNGRTSRRVNRGFTSSASIAASTLSTTGPRCG